jgi:hypothetical protein
MSEGDVDHGFSRCVAEFVVFGEASGPVEPGEGTFDDPAFGKDLEDLLFAAFDDLNGVAKHLAGPVDQRPGVACVGEDRGEGVEVAEQTHQYGTGRDAVLDSGRVHDHCQQIALSIYRDMPFAALDLLACIVAPLPPFSAVLALCESRIATVGMAFRPCALRPCSRRA